MPTRAAASRGQWHEAALSASPALVAGRSYWIAMLARSGQGTLVFPDVSTGGMEVAIVATNPIALPSTWTTGASFTNAPVAFYVVEK